MVSVNVCLIPHFSAVNHNIMVFDTNSGSHSGTPTSSGTPLYPRVFVDINTVDRGKMRNEAHRIDLKNVELISARKSQHSYFDSSQNVRNWILYSAWDFPVT